MSVTLAMTFLVIGGITERSSGGAISPVQSQGDAIVQQLRELPTPLPPAPRSDGKVDPVEQRRRQLYRQLRLLGTDALGALGRGLGDPDVRIRKNVALVVGVLAGGWFEPSEPKLDIRPMLPALIGALQDMDSYVRAWAAQAIGEIGPDAARAVPALITLLTRADEGSRNSACIALRGIGPPAKAALPALRNALDDPSPDLRRFAQRAIDRIQAQ